MSFILNTSALINSLDFVPTNEQRTALLEICQFLRNETNSFFILQGAAGTGKTSLLKALTTELSKQNYAYALAAPTGRAAKIISEKTGVEASTLHRLMYNVVECKNEDGEITHIKFVKKTEFPTLPTLYIIDEASMVSSKPSANEDVQSETSPLEDLFFLLEKCPEGSKIIFIGDRYQLPPVQEDFSKALSLNALEKEFGLGGQLFEMTEVKRQADSSQVLTSASNLRIAIEKGAYNSHYSYRKLRDFKHTIELFRSMYLEDPKHKACYIAWKNKDVHDINQHLRQAIHGNTTNSLVVGEKLVLNRSHFGRYHIPSGESVFIKSIEVPHKEVGGIHFAQVTLSTQAPDGTEVDVPAIINLDILNDPYGKLDFERQKPLYAHRMKNNETFRKSRNKADDPYLSAFEMRYGYAITCHKAQGGEWDNVILHPSTPRDTNRLQWIYTAITRAKQELFSYDF